MLPKFDASAVWANLLGPKMSNAERPSVFTAVPTVYSKLIEEYENKFAAKDPKLKEFVKTTCSTKMRSGAQQFVNKTFDFIKIFHT